MYEILCQSLKDAHTNSLRDIASELKALVSSAPSTDIKADLEKIKELSKELESFVEEHAAEIEAAELARFKEVLSEADQKKMKLGRELRFAPK